MMKRKLRYGHFLITLGFIVLGLAGFGLFAVTTNDGTGDFKPGGLYWYLLASDELKQIPVFESVASPLYHSKGRDGLSPEFDRVNYETQIGQAKLQDKYGEYFGSLGFKIKTKDDDLVIYEPPNGGFIGKNNVYRIEQITSANDDGRTSVSIIIYLG